MDHLAGWMRDYDLPFLLPTPFVHQPMDRNQLRVLS